MADHGRRVVGCPLPGAKLPYLPFRKPGIGEGGKIAGWALADQILGVATHYCLQRTIPCTAHLGECEGCDYWKKSPRWDGFLPVVDKQQRRVAVFQVTFGAANGCEQLDKIDTLRGRLVTLRRKGESATNGVTMTVTDERYLGVLPAIPDLPAALERFWQLHPSMQGKAIQTANWGGK